MPSSPPFRSAQSGSSTLHAHHSRAPRPRWRTPAHFARRSRLDRDGLRNPGSPIHACSSPIREACARSKSRSCWWHPNARGQSSEESLSAIGGRRKKRLQLAPGDAAPPRARSSEDYMRWAKDRLLRYQRTQKSLDWVRHRGLQLPEGGSPAQGSVNTVITDQDINKKPCLVPIQWAAIAQGGSCQAGPHNKLTDKRGYCKAVQSFTGRRRWDGASA
jgi:hypothetical protein